MNDARPGAVGSECFFSSKKSSLAKARFYSWIGLALGFGPLFVIQLGARGVADFPLFLLLMALFVGFLSEWFFRRQLRPGQPLVTLSDEGVAAPNLSGSSQQLRWSEIESISLETIQNNSMLTFLLNASSGRPNKRSFWTGANQGKPALSLAAFSPETQEQLIEAINRRHALAQGRSPEGPNPIGSELRAEREFQERLVALQPVPWVSYALIAINVLIWLFMLSQGGAISRTPAEILLQWGGNAASEVQKGEWWRMLSATFLHSGLMHVAMNMLGLYTAGIIVERIYGQRLYLIIYFGAALMGSALSLNFSAQQAVSVGASGAVFGVTGALLVAVYQNRDKLPKIFGTQTLSGLGVFIIYALAQGFSKQGIDNAAHIGGLLGGCLAAFILPERFDLAFFQRHQLKRSVAALAVLAAVMLGLVAMAPPAAIDQGRIFASADILKRGLEHFDQGMRSLQQEITDLKAGKLSDEEADERSRTVFAPLFRKVVAELTQVVFRPGDPREPFVRDVQHMSELLAEALGMDSVLNEESQKYEPADAQRAEKISAELTQVSARIEKFMQAAKKP
jgi:rhomboid protease GluP